MPGPTEKNQISPDLAKRNADKVAAVLILGAALAVFMGVMLPDWAKDPGPFTTLLSIGMYVFAALGVGLALYVRAYVRAYVRKSQSSPNSSVIQRN